MTKESPSFVIALSLINEKRVEDITKDSKILLVLRSKENETHPGIISVPTQRDNLYELQKVSLNLDHVLKHGFGKKFTIDVVNNKLKFVDQISKPLAKIASDDGIDYFHHPTVFEGSPYLHNNLAMTLIHWARSLIFIKLISTYEAMGKLKLKIIPLVLENGVAQYPNLNETEHILMLNLVCLVQEGAELFQDEIYKHYKIKDYDFMKWVPIKTLRQSYEKKQNNIFPDITTHVCPGGLCISSTIKVLDTIEEMLINTD